MGAAWAEASGAGKVKAAELAPIIRGDEQVTFPAAYLSCDRYPSSGHVLPDICRRTVTCQPGASARDLTGHYRRAHPEAPGLRSRWPGRRDPQRRPQMRPRPPPGDELAAGLDRKTPAVTERGRSMVTAHTKNRRSARALW